MTTTSPQVPEHVPPELVVPFDQLNGPEVMHFPPTAALAPGKRVFYSSCHGGFWVFTKFEDIRAIYQDAETFNQWPYGIPYNPFSKLFKPLYLNPPEHRPWRQVIAPLFAPRQLMRLEDYVRERTRQAIAEIAPKGRCEFVMEFCDAVPRDMFCFNLGLKHEDYPRFAYLAHELVFGQAEVIRKGGSVEDARAYRKKINAEIDEIVAALIPERRAHPGDDVISILLNGEVNGQKLTDEDVTTMATLLFFAGTDSTRAATAYAFTYLARNPHHRDMLVRGEVPWKRATDELMRFHGFHMSARVATRDVEVAGAQIKKGDVITLSTGAANRDPARFPNPDVVDFDRADAHSHLTFGAGEHRCAGSHLATMQVRIALEEVHKVIPDYRIDPEAPAPGYVGGQGKVIPTNLTLVYTPVPVQSIPAENPMAAH